MAGATLRIPAASGLAAMEQLHSPAHRVDRGEDTVQLVRGLGRFAFLAEADGILRDVTSDGELQDHSAVDDGPGVARCRLHGGDQVRRVGSLGARATVTRTSVSTDWGETSWSAPGAPPWLHRPVVVLCRRCPRSAARPVRRRPGRAATGGRRPAPSRQRRPGSWCVVLPVGFARDDQPTLRIPQVGGHLRGLDPHPGHAIQAPELTAQLDGRVWKLSQTRGSTCPAGQPFISSTSMTSPSVIDALVSLAR